MQQQVENVREARIHIGRVRWSESFPRIGSFRKHQTSNHFLERFVCKSFAFEVTIEYVLCK